MTYSDMVKRQQDKYLTRRFLTSNCIAQGIVTDR